MLLHAPFRLIEAILDGMSDAGESLELRRIEAKIIRLSGGLDDKGIRRSIMAGDLTAL